MVRNNKGPGFFIRKNAEMAVRHLKRHMEEIKMDKDKIYVVLPPGVEVTHHLGTDEKLLAELRAMNPNLPLQIGTILEFSKLSKQAKLDLEEISEDIAHYMGTMGAIDTNVNQVPPLNWKDAMRASVRDQAADLDSYDADRTVSD